MEEDDGDPADRRLTGAPFRARSRSRENPAKNVHDMKGQEQEHLKEQEQEEEEEIKKYTPGSADPNRCTRKWPSKSRQGSKDRRLVWQQSQSQLWRLRRPHAQDRGDSDDTWGNTALHCNTMQYNTALH